MASHRIVIFGWSDSVHIQRWTKALAGRGLQIRLISLDGQTHGHVETKILPRKGKLSYILRAGEAAKLALEFKPDLVHTHYASGFGIWGRKTNHSPHLLSVWGSDVVDVPRSMFGRFQVRKTLRQADHISATSEFLKRRCEELLPGSEKKITVIPFGVELPKVPTNEPDSPVRLLFLKKHLKRYGPDVLLRAFAVASKQVPSLCMTMAGDGPMHEELVALTNDLHISKQIDFPGFVPNEQAHKLIEKSHIIVMPSLEEAFGVAAIEGSVHGRPVIATTVGGIPEVICDGQSGILVPPDDVDALATAIIKLASDKELRNSMGQAGKKIVCEQYLWDNCVDRIVALYDRLINEKK